MTVDTHNHSNPEHGDTNADLEGYVLGTLDPDERERITEQLERDPKLRAQLAEIEETVGQLGLGAPTSQPPDGLRQRVLASAGNATSEPAPVSRFDRYSRYWRLAAAALAILLVGSTFYLRGEIDDREERIAELESNLTAANGEPSEEATSSTSVNFGESLIWHELDAHNVGDDVEAYLCYTQDGQIGYVILLGMPMESEDVIQVWLKEDDVRVSAGMFRPDDAGRGFLFFRAPGDSLKAFTSIGMTFEPPGGSDAPTSDPMITGDLQS